ncbi:MAG TPA: DUF2520 domain-containing protein [Fervidobacterium sp.]|nr:DUF2520 domain-containing protein [Fervidobacterium sp.]
MSEVFAQLVNVVGTGKVSSAISHNLLGKVRFGYVLSREFEKAKSLAERIGATPVTYSQDFLLNGIVLFGLSDSVLKDAETLLNGKVGEITAIHFSGFHPSQILPRSWNPASMHPNCAVADENVSFKDVLFGLEGCDSGLEVAKEIVDIIGGRYFIVPTDKKVLYHLAAVISSNFTVGLASLSEKIYEEIGLDEKTARELISHLLQTVGDNISKFPIDVALTGPVKRGDWKVVEMERAAFIEQFPQFSKPFSSSHDCGLYDIFVDILKDIINKP